MTEVNTQNRQPYNIGIDVGFGDVKVVSIDCHINNFKKIHFLRDI